MTWFLLGVLLLKKNLKPSTKIYNIKTECKFCLPQWIKLSQLLGNQLFKQRLQTYHVTVVPLPFILFTNKNAHKTFVSGKSLAFLKLCWEMQAITNCLFTAFATVIKMRWLEN